jgi:aspartyl aminopeptidase
VEADAAEDNIRCVILFDNEEVSVGSFRAYADVQVGSVSNHGAESNLLPSFVERISAMSDYSSVGYHNLLANSFLISADMGHAVSPTRVSVTAAEIQPDQPELREQVRGQPRTKAQRRSGDQDEREPAIHQYGTDDFPPSTYRQEGRCAAAGV